MAHILVEWQQFLSRHFGFIFFAFLLFVCHGILIYAAIWNATRRISAISLLGLVYGSLFCKLVWRPVFSYSDVLYKKFVRRTDRIWTLKIRGMNLSKTFLVLSAFIGFFGWLIYDSWDAPIRLRSFFGIFFIFVFGILISNDPSRINWRPVIGGLILQICLAFLFLRWTLGNIAFGWFSDRTIEFLDFAFNGTDVAYGFASTPPPICGMTPVFVFRGLQILIYFGSIVSVLYYFGVIQWILSGIATVMRLTLGITSVESLNASACVFLGTTEATLLIEPLLATMTKSEIHTIMTVGYACISGSLFAIYIGFGACSIYLLSATVMAASISLSISKLLYPETEISSNKELIFPKRYESSVVECISSGAVHSAKFVLAIAANLLVYMALLSLVNGLFKYAGNLVGVEELSFDRLVGYLFFPIAYVIGVSDAEDPNVAFDETLKVAQLMGLKTTINEFIAYKELSRMIQDASLNGKRARMMATYALCGFTNIPMIGSQIAVLSSMCTEQNSLFAKMAVRSFVAALLSCLVTTCVAGMLIHEPIHCPTNGQQNCLNLTLLSDIISKNNSVH